MIKILAVLIFISSGVLATTLEEYNELIKIAKIPWEKQVLICERETHINAKNADVKECLKAADMILALKGKQLDLSKLTRMYGTVEKAAAAYFNNAGGIYEAHGDCNNATIMYEKAAKQKNPDAINNLGSLYFGGKCFSISDINDIKAFQYYKEALSLGAESAQHNLDLLCKESPRACK